MTYLDDLPHVTSLLPARQPDYPRIPENPDELGQLHELLQTDWLRPVAIALAEALSAAETAAFEVGGTIAQASVKAGFVATGGAYAADLQAWLHDLANNLETSEFNDPQPVALPFGNQDVRWWPDGFTTVHRWSDLPGVDDPPAALASLMIDGRWIGRTGKYGNVEFGGETDSPALEMLRLARLYAGYRKVAQATGTHEAKAQPGVVRAAEAELQPVAIAWYGNRILQPLRAARTFLDSLDLERFI